MTSPSLALSIISHGHSEMLSQLLDDLRRVCRARERAGGELEILLTFNLAGEDRSWLAAYYDLPLRIHVNEYPLGFGANQNAAFRRSACEDFAIVNPDIRLLDLDIGLLQSALRSNGAGAIAPRVVDGVGRLQDSARQFPSLLRLAKRTVTGRRDPEYPDVAAAQRVDWVAGMFVLFRREAWASVGGFDERYFMYFEDVDLCRRLQEQGWSVIYDGAMSVQHDAQRASHRDRRHLAWHVRSAIRFFTGW